jgi:hypothetical protein
MRFRVGLNALLSACPQAQIIGVDQLDVVLSHPRRSQEALNHARLAL